VPLGWIAGKPLEAEELLVEWGDASSRELWLVIDKLVAARLALAEAERLGIRLAPEAVEERFAADRARLEKEIARTGKERPLEEFIEERLGFEPKRYLERVRRATIRQMLAERAVRVASFAEESAALRLIVVETPEAVEAVKAALAAGEAFADVARARSVDDSKDQGGLVPFVLPEERSPLARLAFQTPVGEVAGPLPVGDHQFWVRVEEKRPALEGDWATIGDRIEASLAQHPVGDAEFVHWKLTMERRYPIDLGPLWSLVGAAR
jgi:parvulin-like peptidyl-prolyl isomerase